MYLETTAATRLLPICQGDPELPDGQLQPVHGLHLFAHVSFVVFLLRFPVSPKGVAPK